MRVDNWTAATDPAVSDGLSEGYTPGSRWFNLLTGALFVCALSSVGEAVWTRMSGASPPADNIELREDGGNELREDGGLELRS